MTNVRTYITINVRTKERRKAMSPRTGRPPIDKTRNDRLYVRISSEEKADIQKFCKENDVSILDLIRCGIEVKKSNK